MIKFLGNVAYGLAYILSLLRAPLGLLPYLVKLLLVFGLKSRHEARKTTYLRESLNMVSEILNLVATFIPVRLLTGAPTISNFLWYLPLYAETIRILAERLPITFSALWQLIPHREIARNLQNYTYKGHRGYPLLRYLGGYCRYYSLDDEERATYIFQALKQRSKHDPEVYQRLEYLHAFRIVPQQKGLRGGRVRDVARGEVFIHAIWTGDPWLLIGMALRRAPWSFDPRYLQRPFYYMSGANRAMSLFVLQHLHYSIPYALFQFGHEIRVARLHCFYVLLRWFGFDIEWKVWADSTFQNDQWIFSLKKRFHQNLPRTELPALYSDDEVIAEVQSLWMTGTLLCAQDIAERYIYPMKYVEEVLFPALQKLQEQTIKDDDRLHTITNHS
ncbi:MAG: hypothetical protein JO031_11165 [Ktedonobacteraceae bacterium]|nr:hypothetical protein [Ktedonobacteraceae bacterium]